MTVPSTVRSLADVFAGASAVLLDFDGPVCGIFAGGRNRAIADTLRATLVRAGVKIAVSIERTEDPLVVLRFAADLGRPELLDTVEQQLRDGEVDAARRAAPTAGSADAIQACNASGRRLAIVSNNSAGAIDAYLGQHRLTHLVQHVVGRPYAAPHLMKPHPDALRRAFDHLDIESHACVLIGDSVTDIEAARAVNVAVIGYAKRPERRTSLIDAGADAIADTMSEIAPALRATGPLLAN